MSADKHFAGAFGVRVFRRIHWMYAPYFKSLVTLLIIGGMGRFCLLFVNVKVGALIDFVSLPRSQQLVPHSQTQTYSSLIVTCIILGTVALTLNILFRIFLARMGVIAVSRLYDSLAKRTSKVQLSFFDTHPSGRILSRFSSDYGNLLRMFGGPMGDFLSLLFDFIFMIGILTTLKVYFLGPIILFLFLQYYIYKTQKMPLRKLRRRVARLRGPLLGHFQDSSDGATYLRLFNKLESFQFFFNKLLKLGLKARMGMVFNTQKLTVFMGSNASALLFSMGVLGLFLYLKQIVTLGDLAIAMSFAGLMSSIIQQFFEWITQFEDALTALERINDYWELPIQHGEQEDTSPLKHNALAAQPSLLRSTFPQIKEQSPPATGQEAVGVHAVTVLYAQAREHALIDVNIRVLKGEKFGIIGRSGSGKSTLMKCIFGEIKPHSGHLNVGGYSLAPTPQEADFVNSLPLPLFRKNLCYMPQEASLFPGSIRFNLDPFSCYTNAELKDALDTVGLGPWLNEHFSGALNESLDAHEFKLSGGQKQLFALARVLLSDAQIILMDEPTSSIDPQAESLIMKAAERVMRGKTQIVIAHRLKSIENCHRVLWLDWGRVKMCASPQEVLPRFSESFTFS